MTALLGVGSAALALLVFGVARAVPATAGESRLGYVEVSASGPLERATLDCGAAGKTELALALAAGETRNLLVPVPNAPGVVADASLPNTASTGLTVLGRRGDDERARALARLSVAWLTRPAPQPAPARGPRVASLFFVVAAAAFVARFAARRALALLVGAVGFALVLALELAPSEAPRSVVVLDFTAGEPGGLRRESARHALELQGDAPLSLAVAPDDVRLELNADARGEGPLQVVARAPGAVLVRLDLLESGPPEPTANRFGDLADVWFRESDGRWTFRGDWTFGEPLPGARSAPPPAGPSASAGAETRRAEDALPPLAGWLQTGLPQGVAFLIGRAVEPLAGAAPGEPTGASGGALERSPAGAAPTREVWLRVGGL